ncbi:MAG: leucine-rich repeat protein [Clostridia bacterium]|nr:leucine-rich repeat protein [Clostridia bacterium]
MAKRVYDEAKIAAIAAKIREKTGGDETYTTAEMPGGIDKVYGAGKKVYGQRLADLVAGSSNGVILPDCSKVISSQVFYGTPVQFISFGRELERIKPSAFSFSGTVVFDFSRCQSVPVLENSNAFSDGNLSAVYLIPRNLYGDWEIATNWSYYSWNMLPYDAPSVFVPETPDYISTGLDIRDGVLYGRGTCTDSVIVLPHDCKYIENGAFAYDDNIDTIVLSPTGTYIYGDFASTSSLRVIINFNGCGNSALYSAYNLKVISFLDGTNINNNELSIGYGFGSDIIYDFSNCKSIPQLGSDWYITTNGNYKIYVPAELYYNWIYDTNWNSVYWNDTKAFLPVVKGEI